MLGCLSEAQLFNILLEYKVNYFKDSKAALCLLGISGVCLDSSSPISEQGQFEDRTAQVFPSTGITNTTRDSADLTSTIEAAVVS